MPWEKEYDYSQAVKVGDTIYVAGQVSHDDSGKIVGIGDMEAQMRQSYANIKKVLATYVATMENIVDKILSIAQRSCSKTLLSSVSSYCHLFLIGINYYFLVTWSLTRLGTCSRRHRGYLNWQLQWKYFRSHML